MATVRLTSRGRIALVLFVTALAVLAGLTLGHGSSLAASRSGTTAHPATRTVVVTPGETLWTVADRIAPHTDPRLVVADIESMNHLASPAVESGQQLSVPSFG